MSDKQHWEGVYACRSPSDVSWYQAEPRVSLELIADTGVPQDAPVIDVGGGASLLVDRLLDRGYRNVAVLDLAGNALRHAQQRLGPRVTQVEWYEQDVTAFVAPHRFQVWHDRAVFHFLTDAVAREDYVRTLRRALAPDGQVIIAAFAIGGPTRCSGLDIVQYDAQKMQRELGAEFRLLEERAETHITPAAREQRFGFYRFARTA